eukprot:jgi/Botrbrau1/2786/Bobra.0164s0063.1
MNAAFMCVLSKGNFVNPPSSEDGAKFLLCPSTYHNTPRVDFCCTGSDKCVLAALLCEGCFQRTCARKCCPALRFQSTTCLPLRKLPLSKLAHKEASCATAMLLILIMKLLLNLLMKQVAD